MTPISRAVQIPFTDGQLRLIELLMLKLGIHSRAAVVKYALARLASEENVKVAKKPSPK
jgi:hypothetical protein